jgi:2-polyprenyl-3-methyl-5-hydroxy-6-metoxy-1,4-benzoquinol methylase
MNEQEVAGWHVRSTNLAENSHFYKNAFLEFRFIEEDLPDGPVLDVGCGLGFESAYFAKSGRQVIALDSEESLLKKVAAMSDNITPVLSNMPDGEIPAQNYALCIISNLMHFMRLEDNLKLCHRVSEVVKPGGCIAVRMHSTEHPYADVQHPKNKKIAHFFNKEEMESLFDSNKFTCLYLSHCTRDLNQQEVKLFGYSAGQDYQKSSYSMLVRKNKL